MLTATIEQEGKTRIENIFVIDAHSQTRYGTIKNNKLIIAEEIYEFKSY